MFDAGELGWGARGEVFAGVEGCCGERGGSLGTDEFDELLEAEFEF